MIGLGSEQQIIGEDGKPLYFLLDKRIPVDMDYDKLKPFDEVDYISNIAKFIEKNSSSSNHKTAFADVVDTYFKKDFFSLTPFFINIIIDKHEISEEQLKKMPRNQVLQMLYDLGCPQLFAFHKTATNTVKYGTEHFPNPHKVIPNPLGLKNMWVTAEYSYTSNYLRKEDKNPFIMAFPLEEVFSAEDRLFAKDGRNIRGTDFGVQYLPMEVIDNQQLQKITNKMRVFSIDKSRYQKLETFHKQIKK